MYLKVYVVPKSKKESIEKKKENSFIIHVREPAERNLANERVCELVALELRVPRTKVRIINGHSSPSKMLSIAD